MAQVELEQVSKVYPGGVRAVDSVDLNIRDQELVVLVLTGHLLKDPEYTLNFHRGELFVNESGSELQQLRKPPVSLPAKADAVIDLLKQTR